MERVEYLTREMSRSGGIVREQVFVYAIELTTSQIESMLKYVNPKQSTARDKQLQLYITTGQNTIDESVQMISEVRQDFSEWSNTTIKLLLALQEKACESDSCNLNSTVSNH